MSKTAFTIFCVFCAFISASAQTENAYLGAWEGESKCQAFPSSCHDELVILTIARPKNTPTKTAGYELTMDADKVVAGVREGMGTLGCSLQKSNAKAETFLQCHVIGRDRDVKDKTSFHPTPPYPDVWEFHLSSDKQSMSGTLVLRGELFRKLTVKRRK